MSYNDNEWHLVEFSREGVEGKMVIDGGDLSGRIPHKSPALDLHIPFYLGGIQPDDYNLVLPNLVSVFFLIVVATYYFKSFQNTTTQFNGCIKNFNMNNKPLENPKQFGVIPCSENVEVMI